MFRKRKPEAKKKPKETKMAHIEKKPYVKPSEPEAEKPAPKAPEPPAAAPAPTEPVCGVEGCGKPLAPGQTYVCAQHIRSN